MPASDTLARGCALLTIILWSSAYVFTKVALEHFTSASLGFLRCAIAAATLFALLACRRESLPRRRDVPGLICAGIVGFAVYLPIFNIGMETLNPTTACIIISTSPIITACLAARFFREGLTLLGWGAVFAAFGGVLVLMLWDGSVIMSWGIAWMTAAALLISLYNILQRHLSRRCNPLQITAGSFFFGALGLLFFAPEALRELRAAPPSGIALICFLGVFPSAIAYAVWTKGLSSASKTGVVTNFMFLTPFASLLLEYAVIGKMPGTGTFLGGAIILAALAVFTKAGKVAAPPG